MHTHKFGWQLFRNIFPISISVKCAGITKFAASSIFIQPKAFMCGFARKNAKKLDDWAEGPDGELGSLGVREKPP